MNMEHLGEPTLNLSRNVSSLLQLHIGITCGAFKYANNSLEQVFLNGCTDDSEAVTGLESIALTRWKRMETGVSWYLVS